MSDLAATNCGCAEERCGCDNGCGCGCGSTRDVSNYGNNSCCSILWIIILLCFCGNNGNSFGGNGCGNGDCCCLIIILLLLCGGCGNGCGFGF